MLCGLKRLFLAIENGDENALLKVKVFKKDTSFERNGFFMNVSLRVAMERSDYQNS